MTRSLRHRTNLAVVAALLSLLAFGGAVAADDHQDPVPVPRLTDVSATTQTPALFTVTGQDFTAGGRVYLALYDQLGTQLYETRWITASLPTTVRHYGPGDRWQGYAVTTLGGTMRETFGQLCGATAMMRALDEQTAVWSNWVAVVVACRGESIRGH